MTSTVQTAFSPRLPSRLPHSGFQRRTTDRTVVFGPVFALLLLWGERIRERRSLAGMDAHLLGDIGLTPAEAASEYDKPFWRS